MTKGAIFINAHFINLTKSRLVKKYWQIKLWQICYELPNPPMFSPTKVLYYTVINKTMTIMPTSNSFTPPFSSELIHTVYIVRSYYVST